MVNMRRSSALPLLLGALLLLSVIPMGVAAEEKVLKCSWGTSGSDWGYPSPFAFIPRGPGYTMMSFCFDPLVWRNQTGEFTGTVAESWNTSSDGTVWTFNLHPNLTFHDGLPCTAGDVVFSYQYANRTLAINPTGSTWYETTGIKAITAVDNTTVQITLKTPNAAFLNNVAGVIPIIPEHIWKNVTDPAQFIDKNATIGTGPFIFEDYSSEQQSYSYRANPSYVLGRPSIDRLQFVQTQDPVIALKKGEIDEAGLTKDQADALSSLADVRVIDGPGFWVYRLRFNPQKSSALNQTSVRQAIAYGINSSEMVDRGLHGGGVSGNPGYVPPFSDWYSANVTAYTFDPVKANALLDTAGYAKRGDDNIRIGADGRPLSFELTYTGDSQRLAELVKSELAAIGIGLTLKSTDTKTLDGLVNAGQFDMSIYSHGTSTDPSRIFGGFAKATGWNSSEFSDLLKQQGQTMDPGARKEIVARMQAIVADEVPTLPLAYRIVYSAYRPGTFDGFVYTPNGIAGGVPSEYNKMIFINETAAGNTSRSGSGAPSTTNPQKSPGFSVLSGMGAVVALLLISRCRR
jgi:peptide/nickel transport system substrate-binding protein